MTKSIPSIVSSGNISPASTRTADSPASNSRELRPNSPSPPRGMTRSGITALPRPGPGRSYEGRTRAWALLLAPGGKNPLSGLVRHLVPGQGPAAVRGHRGKHPDDEVGRPEKERTPGKGLVPSVDKHRQHRRARLESAAGPVPAAGPLGEDDQHLPAAYSRRRLADQVDGVARVLQVDEEVSRLRHRVPEQGNPPEFPLRAKPDLPGEGGQK